MSRTLPIATTEAVGFEKRDAELPGVSEREWRLSAHFVGCTYEGLCEAIKCWIDEFAHVRSFEELERMNRGHSGQYDWSFYNRLTCPTRARIIRLRAEADELEADLNGARSKAQGGE